MYIVLTISLVYMYKYRPISSYTQYIVSVISILDIQPVEWWKLFENIYLCFIRCKYNIVYDNFRYKYSKTCDEGTSVHMSKLHFLETKLKFLTFNKCNCDKGTCYVGTLFE